MKDISSVLVMSRQETDPQVCDHMMFEIDCTPTAEMSQVVATTTSLDTASTVSVMDWAECLIEMTVSAGDCDSDKMVANSVASSGNLDGSETTKGQDVSSCIVPVASSVSLDEKNLQHEHQQIHVEFWSTAMNSYNTPLQGHLPADDTDSLPIKSNETNIYNQDSDFIDTGHLESLTDQTVVDENNPHVNPCVPTSLGCDIPKYSYPNFLTLDGSVVRLQPTMSDMTHESQRRPHNLPLSYSDQLTFDTSLPSDVGLELETASSVSISSTQPTLSSVANTTLETPILETRPAFTDTSAYSVTWSTAADVSGSCPTFHSPTESHLTDTVYYELLNDPSFASRSVGHLWKSSYNDATVTRDLTLPDIDIAAVEVVSSNTFPDSTLQHSQDDNSSQFIINPATCRNTESVYQENDTPCSPLEGNSFFDITEFTIETPEASTAYPPQSTARQLCMEASIPHALSSDIKTTNYLGQEFPSFVTYLTYDLSDSQTDQELSIDLLSHSTDSTGQVSYITGVNSSRLADLNTSELIVDNLDECRRYCNDRDTTITSQLVDGEGSKVAASRSTLLRAQTKPETSVVGTQVKHSRKRCLDGAAATSQTLRDERNSLLSTNPSLRAQTISNLRYVQKQEPQQPCRAHVISSLSWESTDVSLPNDFDSLDNADDDCNSSTQMFTSTSSSFSQGNRQKCICSPQSSRYSQFLHQSSSEVTSDALLTPSDLYNPFVMFDSELSLDVSRSNSNKHRTVSDASEISVGDSDVSNIFHSAPVFCTDGEGSQEPLTTDKVKDTLRSKLKAKRETVSFSGHIGSFVAEVNRKSPQHVIGHSPPPCEVSPSTSIGTWSSGQRRALNSRPGSSPRLSPASYISQDESTDEDPSMTDDDEDVEDVLSMPPAQKKRKEDENRDNDEAKEESEGSRLAKREKNRLAAQKCRMRRRDKIDTLTQQVQKLEQKQERIKIEVDKLDMEREQLEEMLRLHAFVCKRKL